MNSRNHDHRDEERCGECPIATSRRRFVRDTGLAVLAAMTAAGLSPVTALANIVMEVRPIRSRGALRTYRVPSTDSVLVDGDNDVIIVRSGDRIYAFSQRCPHKGARLEWREDESRIFCPKHKARFSAGGAHVSGRGSRDLDRYALRLEGREIVVDTDSVLRADRDAAAWRAGVVLVR